MAMIGYRLIGNPEIATNIFLAQSLLITLTRLLSCPKPRTMATYLIYLK